MSKHIVIAILVGLLGGMVLVVLAVTEIGLTSADVTGLTFFLLGGISLWLLARAAAEPQDRAFLSQVIVGSHALRGIWCLLKRTVLADFHRKYLEFEDATGRHYAAMNEARDWLLGFSKPHFPTTLAEAHSYVVQFKTTLLYYLFGPSQLLPQAFIVTGTVSIAIAMYLVLAAGGIPRQMRRVPVLLCAFIPSFIFWHTLDNKDGVTAFCAAWSLLAILWLFQGGERTVAALVLLIGMDLLCLFYRPYVGILLITGQGLAWAYTVKLPSTALGKVARVWLFVLICPIAIWFGVKEMKETYGEEMGIEWAAQAYTDFWEVGKAGGGSAYEINIPARTAVEAIIGIPARILMLLLSPIPVFPGSVRRMLSYPEQWFIYFYVVPAFYWGLRLAFRNRPTWTMAVLLSVGPVILAYALKTSISGEAARMRTQFLPELLLFTGIGRAFILQRKQARRLPPFPYPLWEQSKTNQTSVPEASQM